MRTHINLLPWNHRRAALLRGLLPRWCAAWLIGAALFGAALQSTRRCREEMLAVLSDRQAACRPITAIAMQNSLMEERIRQLDQSQSLVGQLRDGRPVLSFLAAVSEAARLSDGRIVVRDLNFDRKADRPAPAADPAPGEQAVVTLKGDAVDNLAIARFAAALRDSRLFRDVVLESSVGSALAELPVHSFIVRCEI
ncbi:MAG: hypothetical protein ACYC6Y_18675 [Thermoguttaceae bacterium]